MKEIEINRLGLYTKNRKETLLGDLLTLQRLVELSTFV